MAFSDGLSLLRRMRLRPPLVALSFSVPRLQYSTTQRQRVVRMNCPEDVATAVTKLYGTPDAPKVVIATTGGGAATAGWLVGIPGASACVLDIHVPYLQSSMTDFVGRAPTKVRTPGWHRG